MSLSWQGKQRKNHPEIVTCILKQVLYIQILSTKVYQFLSTKTAALVHKCTAATVEVATHVRYSASWLLRHLTDEGNALADK